MKLPNWFRSMTQGIGYIGLAILIPTPVVLAQTNIEALTWPGFLRAWREQEDHGSGANGTGRLPDFCAVTTYGDGVEVWNLNPIYLWQGGSRPLAIRVGDDNTQIFAAEVQALAPVPDTSASEIPAQPQLNLAHLPDQSLTAGESYAWVIYDTWDPTQRIMAQPFQMMDEVDREQVTMALGQLLAELEAEDATPETIALAKADYFLTQDLPIDALQTMFLVETPSPELLESQQALVSQLCEP